MDEFTAFSSAGTTLYRMGMAPEAEQAWRAALDRKPGDPAAEFGLAVALLAQGKCAEGWPYLQARKVLRPDNCKAPADAAFEWRGQSLAGKRLLVMSEQGRGDQIMLARFIPKLRALGAVVTLVAWRDVAPLFDNLADVVVPIHEDERDVPIPPQDYWTHYFSLPELLGATIDNLPAEPYLMGPTDRRVDPSYEGRVGLVWRTRDPQRSLPESAAQQLLDRGLVSLDPEDTGAADFGDTAAIIDQLSLVVTIDTAVAHLAGAMGKPVWVLLPAQGVDWRWLQGRADSPWYPTARLFRTRAQSNWHELVSEVLAALP